jgi:hypothetical protein
VHATRALRHTGCDPSPAWNSWPPNGCGSAATAQLYMLSFTVLVSYVMMNLFVAVILSTCAGLPAWAPSFGGYCVRQTNLLGLARTREFGLI